MNSDLKRLRLRVAAKLMLAVVFFAVLYVILSVILSSDDSTRVMPTQSVSIVNMAPGDTKSVLWDGRPVIIYRRTTADIAALQLLDDRLLDADSKRSRQPDWALNEFRSRAPDWFVSIGVGTDFSCPLRFEPASDKPFKGQPWVGGFRDECRGSRYDLSGRVYKGQYADENLIVPDYIIRADHILLGGR